MSIEIAYIDDNLENLECMRTVVGSEFKLKIFQKPRTFLSRFSESSYASILIDIHMPEIDGFELYEKIIEHPNYNGCPILFISSDDSNGARIKSFELGAVDFLNRDILPVELIARIKSKIKFFEQHRNIIEFGSLRINLTLLKTFVNAREVPLTFIELKFLCMLIRNYPDFILKEEVIGQVWKKRHVLDATIHTHTFNLNVKLKEWEYHVQMVKGKGLQLIIKNK